MKANYEEDKVIVSATEPTGVNRKKVWFKKGKNLFDKNSALILHIYGEPSTNKFTGGYEKTNSIYIEIEPNTTYTISKQSGKTFRVATSAKIPADGVSILNTIANHTGAAITITADSNAKYLFVNYYNEDNGDTAGESVIRNSIQIEQGITATDYEQYIEPEIYILNSNDTYEKFENVSNQKWKLVKTVTGKTVVIIPDGWNEILVVSSVIGDTFKGMTLNIPKEASKINYRLSYYAQSNDNVNAGYYLGNNDIKLSWYKVNDSDINNGDFSIVQTQVYYR